MAHLLILICFHFLLIIKRRRTRLGKKKEIGQRHKGKGFFLLDPSAFPHAIDTSQEDSTRTLVLCYNSYMHTRFK